jgi:uncharacterized repeat protein (TIGR02543 family)
MKSMLKKMVAVFCLMIAMVATVEAQNSFAYQAVIRKANGDVVSEKKVSMCFSLIYNNEEVYVETQSPMTDKYGNVQVEIGKGYKVIGDFSKVPWHTMQVMMRIEVDPDGGHNFIDLGAIQLQPAPYAMHAASTGLVIDSSSPKSGSGALFEVKDKDGNVVFAVFPDGVRVYVDDSDGKPVQTGFAVAGRRAAKDGEEANLFSVTSEGTQVIVDDADGKAMSTGFAVAGRRAAKDGESDLFTVSSTGTQVYINTDADGKPVQTGFAVAGRRAAKDGGTEKYLEINESGTQVYIDDEADGKPVQTGFAVAGRRAAKGSNDNKYMEVTADGTTVYVDTDGKAMSTGFAVAGRRAAKGKNLKLFQVNRYGTHIFIDEDADDKPVQTGFAVAGRRAAKDEEAKKYMVIDADGTFIYVDYEDAKAMQTGFAVAGRRAAKDGTPSSILTVNGQEGTHVYIDDADGKAMSTGFAVAGRRAAKEKSFKLFQVTSLGSSMTTGHFSVGNTASDDKVLSVSAGASVIKTNEFVLADETKPTEGEQAVTKSVFQATSNQGVQIAAESKVVVTGDVAKAKNLKTIEANEGAVLPGPISVFSEIVDTLCSKYANILGQTNGYKLVKIHGKGLYTVNDNYDADGNAIIMFNKNGKVTYNNKSAALVVILTNPDSYGGAEMIFWPCCQINELTVNFGLMAADESEKYLPVEVVVNSEGGVSRVKLLSANEKMGTVELNGVPAYGSIVSAVAKPAPGFGFISWDGYVGDDWRGYRSNPLNIGIGWDSVKLTAYFELMFYNVEFIADPFEGGDLEVVTKKQGISYEDFIEEHHQMNEPGGRTDAQIHQKLTLTGNNLNAGEELSEYGYYDTYGAEFTITAKPAEGFKFKNWNNNPQLTNPVIDVFTVTGDTLLKAIFEPITGTQPFGGKAATLPGVIEAENFDVGLGAFNDVWTENSPSDYRSTTFGIECFNEKNKEYAINYTAGGEWVDYTVKVEKAQKMRWAVRYANYEYPDAQIFISRDGENITGIQNVIQTPSWSNYRTIWGETNSSLPAGEYKLRLNFKNTGNSDQNPFNCNVDKMMFAPTNYALLATDVIQPEAPGGWGAAGHVSGFGFYEVGKTANISAKAEEGYVFDGWYDAGGNRLSTKEDSSVTISGDLHLYAKFVSEEDNGPQSSIYIISNGKTIEVIDGGPINYYDWPKELSGSMTFNQYKVKQNKEVTLSVAGEGKFLGWYYYTLDDSVSIAQGSFEPNNESKVDNWYLNQNNNRYEFTLTPISLENRFVALFEENEQQENNGDKATIQIQTNGEVGLYKILDLNGNSEGIDPTDSLELVDIATGEVTGYIYTYECNVGDSIQLLANVHTTETFYGWYGNYADTEFDELTDDSFSSEWLLGNVTMVGDEPEYSYEYSFKVTKTTNRFVAIFDEEEQQPTGSVIKVKTDGIGEVEFYTYNDQGKLTAITNVAGQVFFCGDELADDPTEGEEGEKNYVYTYECEAGATITLKANGKFFGGWYSSSDFCSGGEGQQLSEDVSFTPTLKAGENLYVAKFRMTKATIQVEALADGDVKFYIGEDQITSFEKETSANGSSLYTFTCNVGDEVKFVANPDTTFDGWWKVGDYEKPQSDYYDEETYEALEAYYSDNCIGGYEYFEFEPEGYYEEFTITIDEGTFANWELIDGVYKLTAKFYVPDTEVKYTVLDESQRTCAITHVGVDFFHDDVTSFEIPQKVTIDGKEYTVTAIGDNAFNGCRDMASVTIPNTITTIGKRAFFFVEKSEGGMKSIEIPNSVTSIGEEAFYGCRYLEKVTLSTNITSIPDGCFCDCWNLHSMNNGDEDGIVIPGNVKSIGSHAFDNLQYKLKKVIISEGVESIGYYAFNQCPDLETFSVPTTLKFVDDDSYTLYIDRNKINSEGNPYRTSEDGFEYLDSQNGEHVILLKYKASDATAVIDNNCKIIYRVAFSGKSSLTSVTIPSGVTQIAEFAFKNCSSLEAINIPEGVTCIGESAFEGCGCIVTGEGDNVNYDQKLTKVTIPSSLKSIGKNAFKFHNIVFVYNQYNYALYLGNDSNPTLCLVKAHSDDITSCNIDSDCRFILNDAFSGCSKMEQLNVPSAITFIGENAFGGLLNINYDGDCGSPTDTWGAFARNGVVEDDFVYADDLKTKLVKYKGSATEVIIPDGVEIIGENAFSDINITSVIIPESVETIEAYAFSGCTGIKSLDIPETVTSIGGKYGYSAFDGIININYNGPADPRRACYENWGANYMNKTVDENFVYEDADKTILKKFIGDATEVEIPSTVTTIGPSTFYLSYITSVSIPESVTEIGKMAFYYCDGLTSVSIPASVTKIGEDAFNKCENLHKATFASVADLCKIAFANEYSNPMYPKEKATVDLYFGTEEVRRTNLEIPSGVESIGQYAFYNCKQLTSVSIPASVKRIGANAFGRCGNISKMTIAEPSNGNGLQEIGYKAFNQCAFSTIILPNTLTTIGNNAFDDCDNLVSVVVPESVISMGNYVFSYIEHNVVIFCLETGDSDIARYEGWGDYWDSALDYNPDAKVAVVKENRKTEQPNIVREEVEDGNCLLYFVYRNNGEGVSNIYEGTLNDLITIRDNVTFQDGDAFAIGYHGTRSQSLSLGVPATVGSNNPVVAIARNAFYGENLTSFTLGSDGSKGSTQLQSNIKIIGKGAFCGITSEYGFSSQNTNWKRYNGSETSVVQLTADELKQNSCNSEYYVDE